MVHRPADSRLLTNLLSHEKDYSKHLSILLDYSQASLASFSAYAAASAPPTSQVIIAVAGALAGADDALRNYAAAVEQWQEQLKALKAMEDSLGNIMRDREILVTRLIKATKQQKHNSRDSIIGSSPSGSSLSITKPEVQVGQKMSTAQAELQACEAHLAAKEQELHAFRAHTIRSGLQARCKAMVGCGWAWGEMGKEGIRALETLDMNGHGSPSMHPYMQQKPLPNYENAPSDVSSIAPSQSASQIGHASTTPAAMEPTWRSSSPTPAVSTPPKPYTLQIPPAHSISEYAVPNGTSHPTIFEEPGSSAEEDEDVPVEVHENPRFAKGKPKAKPVPQSPPPSRHISFSVRGPKASPSESTLPTSLSLSLRGDPNTKKRGRAGSVFGSLATLFHVGSSRKEAEGSPSGSPSKSRNGWHTRIDRNLAAARRGGGGDSSDDEQVSQSYAGPSTPPSAVLLNSPTRGRSGNEASEARLKKRSPKRSSVQTQSPTRQLAGPEKGYASDTVTESMSKARAKSNRQKSAAKRSTVDGYGGSIRLAGGGVGNGSAVAGPSNTGRLKKSPTVNAIFAAEGSSSLSRNSSISKQSVNSVASAPPRMTIVTQSTTGRHNSLPRKRTASLDVPSSPPKAGPATPVHKRTVSTSNTPTPTRPTLTTGEPSLMSIVEGLSRMNKEAAVRQDPDSLLVVPKAPGPINIAFRDSLSELPVVMVRGPSNGSPSRSASTTPTRRERPKTPNGRQAEDNYRNSLLMSASVSAPSLPLQSSAGSSSPALNTSKPLPTPAKMPLRSALRNSSRTPSPNPPARVGGSPSSSPKTASIAVPQPLSVSAPAIAEALSERPSMSKRRESDISSISSYETGREELDSEPPTPDARTASSPPASASVTPAPPPETHVAEGSEVSHSTNSTILNANTNGDQPPKRRKSVRMSLPPTFSATPPAIEDTDEDDAGQNRHAPWASPGGGSLVPRGWGTRIEGNGARDVWEDSSDEDAEYSAARWMLSRLSRKHEH